MSDTEARLREYLRRAIDDLDDAREQLDAHHARRHEPIAIVSAGCRLPGGVTSPDDLWQLLLDERDAIGPFPQTRGWDSAAPRSRTAGTAFAREGGFIPDVEDFDAAFFGISPREATAMDPQQRLLLETTWEAVERGGIDPHTLHGSRTGVYFGVIAQEYGPRLYDDDPDLGGHLLTGTTSSVASGRIAYTLGLRGPAITVDTACSSSLVALHLAVRALRADDCDLALVGGASVLSTPGAFVELSRSGALSPTGRCHAFGDDADGTGWSEGAVVLVVERLSDAVRHGHPILATVLGTATNQDGTTNGLSAPSGSAQQQVILEALRDADVAPADVDLVEAHGTGTRLGDPIEAAALQATYGAAHTAERPVFVGSLKSNLGHTQAAAGAASVLKAALAMRAETIPRSLHADRPSSLVDWSSGGFLVADRARPWSATGKPRRVGVSAFGISGTNVHVLLEEPTATATADPHESDEAPADDDATGSVAIAVSGASAAALRAQASRLADVVRRVSPDTLRDLAYASGTARAGLAHRAAVVAEDADAAARALDVVAAGGEAPDVITAGAGTDPRPVFVFPGQGSQWPGMARELLRACPPFRRSVEDCVDAFSPHLDWSLADVLVDAQGSAPIERADVVQPLLFTMMVSLAAAWRAYGVEPAAVIGHSQGEVAAATVAGALDLAEAARLIACRSRLWARLSGHGGMVSVLAASEQVEEWLDPWRDRIGIAAVNSRASTTVSGDPAALAEFGAMLSSRSVPRWPLPGVDFASHSPQVEALRDDFFDEIGEIQARTSHTPMFSTLLGGVVDTAGLDADYWFRNMREPVLFERAVRASLDRGHRAFAEMSPHPLLTPALSEVAATLSTSTSIDSDVAVLDSLRRDHGSLHRLVTAVAAGWTRGLAVSWAALSQRSGPVRAELPTYAFQRERYWPAPATPVQPLVDDATAEFWTDVEDGTLPAEVVAAAGGLAPDVVRRLTAGLTAWRRDANSRAQLDSWTYSLGWDELADDGHPVTLAGRWLIVTPAEDATAAAGAAAGTLRQVCAALRDHGAEVRVLCTGDESLPDAETVGEFDGVVSLLALDERPGADHTPRGLAANIALVQAARTTDDGPPLWLLTSDADGDEARDASAEQATTRGLGLVGALEYPRSWGGLLEVHPAASPRDLARALSGGLGEDQLLATAGGLRARRLRHDPVGDLDAAPRPRDTAVITGGSGALAAHAARWLAGQGAARIVLLSRRGPAAPGTAELAAELRESGVVVEPVACDLTDAAALDAAVDRITTTGPPVRWVLHTAGVATMRRLADETPDSVSQPLAAKLTGTRNLIAALTAHDVLHRLDALVLYSSVSAVWGGGGQAVYGAANAALIAFAERLRDEDVPATAVCWGAWHGAGMAADGEIADRLRRNGVREMDPGTAVAALPRAVASGRSCVVVSDMDWGLFAPAFTAARPSPLLGGIAAVTDALHAGEADVVGAPPQFVTGLGDLTPTRRLEAWETAVAGQVAAALGHHDPDRVDLRQPFKDLGLDSLTAVELRNRLHRLSGLALPTTFVFDYPTVAAAAQRLDALAFPEDQNTGDDRQDDGRGAQSGADSRLADMDAEDLIALALEGSRS